MEFRAEARFQRVSPQKVRLVLDLIKGMRVERALDTLAFTKKRIAPDIHKLVRSAVQNATYLSDEKGLDIDVEDRKSTRLNSSHLVISYAVFCLKKKQEQRAYYIW